MWESTAEVTRRAVVPIPPERAWSLVSGAAAWSLRPGHFAFDVPEMTPAGRLRCWCFPFGQGLGCSVQEVREEVPGQVLRLLSRGTQPAGRQAFTLSARPHDRGAEIELTAAVTVPREDKADYQAFWRKELRNLKRGLNWRIVRLADLLILWRSSTRASSRTIPSPFPSELCGSYCRRIPSALK